MSEIKTRIAFMVGAGLVYEAGLPMSVGLAQMLKDKLGTICKSADEDAETMSLAGLELATFRFLNGGIRFKEGVLNRDPDADINIEQIAVAALELQARLENPLAPYMSGWHPRIVELEAKDPKILSRFIDFIYSKLEEWLTFEDEEKIAYLARLADFARDETGIDIFSLNYDLCIETAFTDIKRDFVNGFNEDGWYPELLQENSPIRLFKLHGSLDWFEDPDLLGVASFKFPRHKDAENFPDNLRPLLIFGTAHKLSSREPFLSLAYHFSQSLLRSPVLVVIGYSFGDKYLNDIVEQGFRTNGKLKIVVVSPRASELIERRDAFRGSPRVRCINKGAKSALNDGLLLRTVNDLLSETLEEEPF
jgi:SIR2-like domain